MLKDADWQLNPDTALGKAKRKMEFQTAFIEADLGPIFMEEIPNGYWGVDSPYSVGDPWYTVTTRLGHFKVGWRKRVIHLDWEKTLLKDAKGRPIHADKLFPDENVTRFETGIHCWGLASLVSYLKTIAIQTVLFASDYKR